MTRLAIATAPTADTAMWTNGTTTWPAFVKAAAEPADHKECGGYLFGVLGSGRLSRRNKETVVNRSAITLDVDHAPEDLPERVARLGFAALVHTTYRSTPEELRYRVASPLSRPVTPEEYRIIVAYLVALLGLTPKQYDACSEKPEQFMYRPSAQDPANYSHRVFNGDWLDADQALANADMLGVVVSAEPVVTVEADGTPYADLPTHLQKMADDDAERTVTLWRERLDNARTWPERDTDDDGRGWEMLARDAAWALAQRGHAAWSPLSWEDAEGTYGQILPAEIAANEKCQGKWPEVETVAAKFDLLAPWQKAAADFDVLPPEPEPLSEVWDASPMLATIRQAAHARLLSAPALLAVVLARVLVEVPPSVALPPVIGGRASLNFGVAIVGSSGSGKSALMAVSRELLGLTGSAQEALERSIGSGEGLVQTFLQWDTTIKANVLLADPRRLLLADEVDQLAATQQRSGATLAPVVRSALTGASLGQENADATRRRHVPGGRYRLGLVVGVQPTRAGALLDDADAGTPQRLLWCRATDPSLPDDVPGWPTPLDWQPPELGAVVDYPDAIKAEVRAVRVAHVRDGADGLTGHRMLLQLKVGAALALLHGEAEISPQWWEVAGVLVEESGAVQGECRRVLAAEVTEQRRALGRLDGIRAEGQAAYQDEQARSVAVKVWRVVDRHSRSEPDGNAQRHGRADGCTSRCISKALQHQANRNEARDAALAYGVEAEWLTEADGRWLPGPSQPAREAS